LSTHRGAPSPVLMLGLRIGVFIVVLACMVLPALWSDKSSAPFIINILSILIGLVLVSMVLRAIQQNANGEVDRIFKKNE
jgi:hypothetical protein